MAINYTPMARIPACTILGRMPHTGEDIEHALSSALSHGGEWAMADLPGRGFHFHADTGMVDLLGSYEEREEEEYFALSQIEEDMEAFLLDSFNEDTGEYEPVYTAARKQEWMQDFYRYYSDAETCGGYAPRARGFATKVC